jgi:uncharacterized radical SAM superfamily Fe-S cluster-containing enzyme
MGTFQMKTFFLGMMHFQDEYTYDIHRVEKCDIHYAMPDGEVLAVLHIQRIPRGIQGQSAKAVQHTLRQRNGKRPTMLDILKGQVQ